ncbi:MAG: aminotransferase class III-fold pyridoxal phosphate-dependent enzyme, partial [Methylococcales bacterium]|nr:aminotransferase class III-fold pyridoxal phosphate-dependent enzyme [Methylococcales bacterium]
QFQKSNALYQRALKTIPLASQTFSKSAMMYVNGVSPLFIDHGKGAYVWDVDGNQYIDYVSALMPVILGYCDEDINRAIIEQLDKGIIFSLSSELEIALSEKLVELIPCAEMVRFGKNGSDATSAAIRIARAYNGRDKVAVAGYHGWHDWYIGSTARHLGVPDAVRGLTETFKYNDAESLETLLKNSPNEFSAVILEPDGAVPVNSEFLQQVRGLTEKYGVVLIFDEIVTGFRIHMGGAQAFYGVVPDLATFGKAMGNGMPISAIVGQQRFMKKMDDIFFSGTFGGETLSLVASLATIHKLEEKKAVSVFSQLGNMMMIGVEKLIAIHQMSHVLSVSGGAWWPRITVAPTEALTVLDITSLFRQSLISQGLLLGGGFNFSLAHSDAGVADDTLSRLDASVEQLQYYLNSDKPMQHLAGDPIQPVFQVRK